MESLERTSINEIAPVPGLYISDRFAARSLPLLQSLHIKSILSVTRSEDVPKFGSSSEAEEGKEYKSMISMKHIDIDDDPTEDILYVLQNTCEWIDERLKSKDGEEEGQRGVLVHCTQGMSRSGAIIVGYLMRKFSLDYAGALALARDSRRIISPNTGFARQLQIWSDCQYSIFAPATTPAACGEEKEAYKVWKAEHDGLLGRGEEALIKARVSAMASMAAGFGKMREERKEEKEEDKNYLS